jgi:hypothetical protein
MTIEDTRLRSAGLAAALALAACSKTPAEPDRPPPAATAEPTVKPLAFDPPVGWTSVESEKKGETRALYKVPKIGDDKEDGELRLLFFGTGTKGDPMANVDEWLRQFDGDVGKTAKRESFDVGAMKVDTIEVAGTYKVPLGPAIGPNKKTPMQMVKEKWRLYGAVVKTPDRGNWFFKMVGPDDTIQAARSALRNAIETAR